jgi:hypothetical protein
MTAACKAYFSQYEFVASPAHWKAKALLPHPSIEQFLGFSHLLHERLTGPNDAAVVTCNSMYRACRTAVLIEAHGSFSPNGLLEDGSRAFPIPMYLASERLSAGRNSSAKKRPRDIN